MNEKKLREQIKFYPHKGQQQVLDCDNSEKIICAGRGWGKSAICGYIVVRFFLEKFIELKEGKRDSIKVFIVAPTYALSRKVFDYVVKFLLVFDKGWGQYISGGENRPPLVKISESVWIQCKTTAEPFGLLGERVDLLIADEAPLIPEKVFHQYIEPTIGGLSIYIGTPRGEGWFKNKFYILKDKGAAFHFRSKDGVYYKDKLDILTELEKTVPVLLFEQEYLAKFVTDAGIVFRRLDDIIVPQKDILSDAVPGHYYIMGVDLAEMEDYTVMTVLDTTTGNIVHQDRFKGREYPLQKKQILAKAERYNNARIILDTSGLGRPVYEDLLQAGVFVEDFTFTGKSKEELLGGLIVNVEEKYIRIPDIPVLVDEMRAYEYLYRNPKTGLPYKNIKYGAPAGYHDDCVDSLALAVWGFTPRRKPKPPNKLKEELIKRSKRKIKSFI